MAMTLIVFDPRRSEVAASDGEKLRPQLTDKPSVVLDLSGFDPARLTGWWPRTALRCMLGGVNVTDWQGQIRALQDQVAILEQLADLAKREASGFPSGHPSCEVPLSRAEADLEEVRQLLVAAQVFGVTERDGPGPYPFAELIAMTGADPDRLREVLGQMVADGVMGSSADGHNYSLVL
ncbi:hypothetical protein [Promicromonospora sp. NPDC057488]|uniref:hypothetical protein n=1 Tax=Promicromonospora sp. NPDC057488 TaxID=3346147 RepID=UPI003670CF7F